MATYSPMMRLGTDPGNPWVHSRDGDDPVRHLFDRHYSRRRSSRSKLFVGPGQKTVLRTLQGDAIFVWRQFIPRDNQRGVCCAVFRNESQDLSSRLISFAMHIAWQRWPGMRLYTYVNPRKVASPNPGYCFIMAGWRRCGRTARGLHILEALREWFPEPFNPDANHPPGQRRTGDGPAGPRPDRRTNTPSTPHPTMGTTAARQPDRQETDMPPRSREEHHSASYALREQEQYTPTRETALGDFRQDLASFAPGLAAELDDPQGREHARWLDDNNPHREQARESIWACFHRNTADLDHQERQGAARTLVHNLTHELAQHLDPAQADLHPSDFTRSHPEESTPNGAFTTTHRPHLHHRLELLQDTLLQQFSDPPPPASFQANNRFRDFNANMERLTALQHQLLEELQTRDDSYSPEARDVGDQTTYADFDPDDLRQVRQQNAQAAAALLDTLQQEHPQALRALDAALDTDLQHPPAPWLEHLDQDPHTLPETPRAALEAFQSTFGHPGPQGQPEHHPAAERHALALLVDHLTHRPCQQLQRLDTVDAPDTDSRISRDIDPDSLHRLAIVHQHTLAGRLEAARAQAVTGIIEAQEHPRRQEQALLRTLVQARAVETDIDRLLSQAEPPDTDNEFHDLLTTLVSTQRGASITESQFPRFLSQQEGWTGPDPGATTSQESPEDFITRHADDPQLITAWQSFREQLQDADRRRVDDHLAALADRQEDPRAAQALASLARHTD